MVNVRRRPRALSQLIAIAVLAAAVLTGVGPAAHPAEVRAGTADTMEAQILALVNQAREKKGLVALRAWYKLTDMAGDRAASMARNRTMSHTSCLSCLFNSYGVQRYLSGEIIAASSYPWGSQAATTIFNGWKASPTHWGLLMSNRFNYIGLGVALGSNGTTYADGELSESLDVTKPYARANGASKNGTTVSFTWYGYDRALQTHTAGLKSFDVQYRVGSGSWSTIRSGTTSTSLSLTNRAHGYYYGIRVRARDNRGNLSSWSSELRLYLP